ncbi:MAG: polymorphic toxin-type HINT domain-containing protein [Formosimonas sp.]
MTMVIVTTQGGYGGDTDTRDYGGNIAGSFASGNLNDARGTSSAIGYGSNNYGNGLTGWSSLSYSLGSSYGAPTSTAAERYAAGVYGGLDNRDNSYNRGNWADNYGNEDLGSGLASIRNYQSSLIGGYGYSSNGSLACGICGSTLNTGYHNTRSWSSSLGFFSGVQETGAIKGGGFTFTSAAITQGYAYSSLLAGVSNGIGLNSIASGVMRRGGLPLQATCSFRGDMQVRTKDGYNDIANIQVGDLVFARNEVTGQDAWQRVEKLHQRTHPVTVYLTLTDAQGQSQTIVSNDKHPYFAQVNSVNDYRQLSEGSEGHQYRGEQALGQWMDAQNLKKGYRLKGENGQWLTVQKVQVEQRTLKAYNLTVAHDHTYFIKAPNAKQGVWVHNEGICTPMDSIREPGLQYVSILPIEHVIGNIVNLAAGEERVVSFSLPVNIRGAWNAIRESLPRTSRPNDVRSNPNRTREYDSNGNAKIDYDAPHQGHERPHVHEWNHEGREHPGRDYSPWP